ncbi:MAG: LamG-like jellyroll fold domain-containing protein [Verrucomicrobiia bacterium]
MNTNRLILSLAVLALASVQLRAQTNVIYFDPFTAGEGSFLNGSTPQEHGGVGTEVWTAPDDGINMETNVLSITSGSRWSALPFVPEDGNKYRISMDMSATHTGSDWFAIGFAETPTPTSDYPAQQLSGWLLIRGFNPGYPLHSFTGYGTDGGGQAGNFTGPHTISVVLDTTVANWTFEYFVDGVSQRGPVPFSATPDVNPSIGYVTFGSYGTARGTMDNFKLENIFHVETGPPTIATQPKDATVLRGGTAKFEVLAAGPKPITYQWLKNGQALAGETGSQLTLLNLGVADSGGKISARVSNSYGTTPTSEATLTVLDVAGPLIHKITFNDGTANDSVGGIKGEVKGTAAIEAGQLLLDGSDGAFVQLTDYPMPPGGSATVVAWFRTSSTVGKSSRVFDFGSGTLNYLYFTPMTAVGGTARFGIKTGEDAETAVSSTPMLNDDLDHWVAAVIDNTPTDTGFNGTMLLYVDGVEVGRNDLNGSIDLAGLAVGPQNYLGKSQWVNTGDLPYKGLIDEIRVYSKALSASEIAALAPDANPAAAPSIDVQPQDTFVNLGGSATLLVGALGSTPLTYHWRFNGTEIAGSNTNVFTLANVKQSDFGSYDVVVANSLGAVTSRVARVSLAKWTFQPWTDDATAGIDTKYVYTHAYNFGSAENTEIGGLTFTAVEGGNPSVAESFALTGVANVYNSDPNNIPDGTGSRVMANDFLYGGNPGTLTLHGLVPGTEYLLTLYSMGWEDAGRTIQFSSPDGQQMTIDQDTYLNDNGIRISYEYTADSPSVSITTAQVGIGTFHMYGFSNRELNLPGSKVTLLYAKGTAGSVVFSWPESATGFKLNSSPGLGAAANWQPVATAPVVSQGYYQVTLTPTGTQFYRLQK